MDKLIEIFSKALAILFIAFLMICIIWAFSVVLDAI